MFLARTWKEYEVLLVNWVTVWEVLVGQVESLAVTHTSVQAPASCLTWYLVMVLLEGSSQERVIWVSPGAAEKLAGLAGPVGAGRGVAVTVDAGPFP